MVGTTEELIYSSLSFHNQMQVKKTRKVIIS